MNFEFKSTFKRLKTRLTAWPHTAWILGANTLMTTSAAWAYLNNLILPATIGSRYYGHYYVRALETGAQIMVASSIYAAATLLFRLVARWHQRNVSILPNLFAFRGRTGSCGYGPRPSLPFRTRRNIHLSKFNNK